MSSLSYLHISGKGKILAGNRKEIVRFYNLCPLHYKYCAAAAPIVSTFVVHRVAETLRGTAYHSRLHFALDFKTVSELKKIGITDLKQSAVFVLKQLANILIVVLSDSRPYF
jgi:hypothetical protein